MTATPCRYCGCLPAGTAGHTGTHRPGCESLRPLVEILAEILRCQARAFDALAACDPPTDRHEDEPC